MTYYCQKTKGTELKKYNKQRPDRKGPGAVRL